MIRVFKVFLVTFLLFFAHTVLSDEKPEMYQSNSTSGPMYFHSYVQDSPGCNLTVDNNGEVSFGDKISNPAATCPDTFAWVLLLNTIKDEFWVKWGNDETLWPEDPKPMCSKQVTSDCCVVTQQKIYNNKIGYLGTDGVIAQPDNVGGPATHCPYIPSDYSTDAETTFAAGNPVSSHSNAFLRVADPGRITRQQEVEVVYRNNSFMYYTAQQDLYSIEGLQRLFARDSSQAQNSMPFRPLGQSVSYPTDAFMLKVDWIPEQVMIDQGYISKNTLVKDRQKYITIEMNVSTDQGKTYQQGMYYLLAITAASKALPNWHWFAFEHVDNLARCDFTGCNDSFGFSHSYQVVDPSSANGATMVFDSNFVPPHVEDDDLQDNVVVFKTGQTYPSGEMSDALAQLFSKLNVASGSKADAKKPTISDPAWKNYRLKGTQTQYYENDGYPTLLGASITEGGFVNTASCLSCHVQAAVNDKGRAATGIGSSGRLSMIGLPKMVSGAPSVGDYYIRGTTTLTGAQVDFVWGILNANPAKSAINSTKDE